MHDFSCWDPNEMHYPIMKAASSYYKETPEGVEYMCQAFEETRREGFERGMQQGLQQGMQQTNVVNIRNLMETFHLSAEQAMKALKIPVSERDKYMSLL